jgi:protein-disulfide isomerase
MRTGPYTHTASDFSATNPLAKPLSERHEKSLHPAWNNRAPLRPLYNSYLEILLDRVHEWDHVRGTLESPFTLVEYGDYECPDCGRLFTMLRDLQGQLKGRLRLVYRHYPLSGIHKHAQMAAEAAEAADAQGRFWEMHDLLFENQGALERKDLIRYAEQLGLDADRFRRELKEGRHQERVRQNFIAGVQNGVNGTPGLFLNGVRERGVVDERYVRELLGV